MTISDEDKQYLYWIADKLSKTKQKQAYNAIREANSFEETKDRICKIAGHNVFQSMTDGINKAVDVPRIWNSIRSVENINNRQDESIESIEREINELQQQNQNQAEIITTQTNSLNQQAIGIASLKTQNEELINKINKLEHILCSHVDCNAQVIGEVEPGTDGLNQML